MINARCSILLALLIATLAVKSGMAQDGSLAAHFEFTIAVTAQGPRILTPWQEAS